jgi:hypothetical protein
MGGNRTGGAWGASRTDLHVGLVAGSGLGAEGLLETAANNLGADVGVAKVRDADLPPGFLHVACVSTRLAASPKSGWR